MKKITLRSVFGWVFGWAILFAPLCSFAVETASTKDLLFEHIGDQYTWEIGQIKGHELRLPLPVFLISKYSGVHVFRSTRLSNGSVYKGFYIATEGPLAKKIVERHPLTMAPVRPLDLSVTKNVASLLFSAALLLWLFLSIAKRYERHPLEKPKGLQAWMEPLILFIQNEVIQPAIPEDYRKYTPYLQTAFFFIFLNNLLGMIPFFPGGANLTGNIAVTLVLAMVTYFTTSLNGSKHYWKEIFWPEDIPLFLKFPLPLFPLIEFFSTLTKPIALTIRLFANMLAGHLMILVLVSLIFILAGIQIWAGVGTSFVAVAFSIFLSILELLVAFIQAFVFTQLSALFIGLAVDKGPVKTH